MATSIKNENHRRVFLKTTFALGAITTLSGLSLLTACKEKAEEEKKVSPPEDLMQEHGLLNRVLLIYDFCRLKMLNKELYPFEAIAKASQIIRTFVEDYHEKQEEDYLFPRFLKANKLTGLVDTLLKQHQAGRKITGQLMQISRQATRTEGEIQKLIELLTSFNSMYRPHEAREDTVLFPAFRKIVSRHEYDSLGEEFENNEHKIFGEDGFETMVDKVAAIEKQLGIYEIAQFTPDV
jgi:hemerythrin-like domain-containing protein